MAEPADVLKRQFCSQQITQHQERFVQMLNEPLGGEAEAAQAQGAPQTSYIQVTQQEKEAIERVRLLYTSFSLTNTHLQASLHPGAADGPPESIDWRTVAPSSDVGSV